MYIIPKEKVRASQVAYKAAHREKINFLQRRYVAKNPETIRALEHSRRARERNARGSLSKDVAQRLMALQKGRCACGCREILGDNYHLDHIMPLALGGSNTDDNIQLLRASCNQHKSAKHPIEFMQSRGFLL